MQHGSLMFGRLVPGVWVRMEMTMSVYEYWKQLESRLKISLGMHRGSKELILFLSPPNVGQ